MSRPLTVVMYHYVRDLKHSRYPDIKGIDQAKFRDQLVYLMKRYEIIRMEELIEAINGGGELAPNACLLTFDDAYIDHYLYAFPLLDEFGVQGSFFAPIKAITHHEILSVNKIHFVLAAVADKQQLVKEIYELLNQYRDEYDLRPNEEYYREWGVAGRFDTPDVVFIKRILQVVLDKDLRRLMLDHLFSKFVGINESVFARELYMDVDQLKLMIRKGMYVGSHGFDHFWLNSLSRREQEREIDLSLSFLDGIGCDTENWAMCYPYGSRNDALIEVIKSRGCVVGLTTDVNIADLDRDDTFQLPRLDTNDFPPQTTSEKWFAAVSNK